MAIKESLLTVVNSIGDSDFVRAVTSAGASRKLSVSNLAKHIVETYNGSTIAGSAQSVKSAVDGIKTEVDALNSNTEITGITAGSNISNLEAVNIFKTGRMVTGNIIFRADADLAATNAVIASGLPSANYRRQVNGICIAGSLTGQSTRFAVYQGNLTTFWSNNVPAGTTWNVTFAYSV